MKSEPACHTRNLHTNRLGSKRLSTNGFRGPSRDSELHENRSEER